MSRQTGSLRSPGVSRGWLTRGVVKKLSNTFPRRIEKSKTLMSNHHVGRGQAHGFSQIDHRRRASSWLPSFHLRRARPAFKWEWSAATPPALLHGSIGELPLKATELALRCCCKGTRQFQQPVMNAPRGLNVRRSAFCRARHPTRGSATRCTQLPRIVVDSVEWPPPCTSRWSLSHSSRGESLTGD